MAKEIEAERKGARCLAISSDVRDIKSLEKAVEETINAFGRIDFVIAGAAGNFLAPIDVNPLSPPSSPLFFQGFYPSPPYLHVFVIISISNTTSGPLLQRFQNSPRNRHPRLLQHPQSHNPTPQTNKRQHPLRQRNTALPRDNPAGPRQRRESRCRCPKSSRDRGIRAVWRAQ